MNCCARPASFTTRVVCDAGDGHKGQRTHDALRNDELLVTATNGLIDNMFLRVATMLTFFSGQALTNATGCLYLQDKFLYLVTSRHVVIDKKNRHYPDSLQESLHSNAADLTQRYELSIPLHAGRVPQCYQRLAPQSGTIVNVVGVAFNDAGVPGGHVVSTFSRGGILNPETLLPLGQDLLIVGFPPGIHDTVNNLPIVRTAMLASSCPHPFKGEPYFLIDARLHRGMSGSPVITRRRVAEVGQASCESRWWLPGVHSSALDVSDRNPRRDERLGLDTSYYATLLPGVLSARPYRDTAAELIAKQTMSLPIL